MKRCRRVPPVDRDRRVVCVSSLREDLQVSGVPPGPHRGEVAEELLLAPPAGDRARADATGIAVPSSVTPSCV
jgi:hypothetical protein